MVESPLKKPGIVQRLGSRLCGLVCGTGCLLKRALCALVPSMATITTLPALAIMLAMPVVLNEMCTKVSEVHSSRLCFVLFVFSVLC